MKTLHLLKILFVACFLCAVLPQTAQAQQWEWVLVPQNANGAALRTNFYLHAADKTGNLYAVSQSADTVNIGNSQLVKPFLTKFSPLGGVIWSKSIDFGNNYRYNSIVRAIQCDTNENVYLSGYVPKEYTTGVNLGDGKIIAKDNYFLAKYSPQGDCLWAKVIKGHFSQGEARPYGNFVMTLDKENNLYLYHDTDVNYTIDNLTYTIAPANTVNGVLTKYNSEGAIQWIRKLYDYESGLNSFTLPLLKNLKTDSQNNIIGVFEMQLIANIFGRQIIGGMPVDMFKQNDIVIAKVDNNFTIAWFKLVQKNSSQFSYGLNIDKDDNILFNYFGYTYWDPGIGRSSNLIIKYNPTGNVVWEKDVSESIGFAYDGSSTMGNYFATHKLSTLNPVTNHLLCFGAFGSGGTQLESNLKVNSLKRPLYDCRLDLLVTSLNPEGKFQWAVQGLTDATCVLIFDKTLPSLNEIVSSQAGHSYVAGYLYDSLQVNGTWYLNKRKRPYDLPLGTFIAKIAQFCPEPALPVSVQPALCKPTQLSVPACADCRFQWYKDSQPIAQATQNSYAADISGSYSVTIAKPTCMLRSEQVAVKVQFPELPAVIMGNAQRNLCRLADTLKARPVAGANYQWYRNGEKIGSNSPNLFINQSGTYTVALQKADCSITSNSNAVVVNFIQIPVSIDLPATATNCERMNLSVSISNIPNPSNPPFYQYEWRKDGQVVSVSPAPFIATESGSYTVTVRRDSCIGISQTVFVKIVPNEALSLLPLSNSVVCDSVTLFVKEKAEAYIWTRNGEYWRYTQQPTLFVTESGSYRVILGGNCSIFSAPAVVTVVKKPSVKLLQSSPVYFCGNGLLAIDNPSPDLVYWWYKDGKHLPEANNQATLRLGADGAGEYRVEVKDKGTICSSFSAPVRAEANKIKAALRPNAPTFFCERGLLQADSSSLFSYEWARLLPTGKQIVGNRPTLTVTKSGTYQLKIQQATCADSLTLPVVVYQFPTNLTIQGSASFFCSNSPAAVIRLEATPLPDATYSWFLNGNTLPQTSAAIQVSQTGTYTASAKLPNGCQKSIGQFTIRNQPAAFVSINTKLNSTNLANWVLFPNPTQTTLRLESAEKTPLTIQIHSPQPTWTNIKWYHNDKLLETATGKTSITSAESGFYTARLTDANGCETSGSVQVNSPKPEEIQASIVDLLGRIVWQQTLPTSALQTALSIEVGYLAPSLYFLHLQSAKDKVVKKFVKE